MHFNRFSPQALLNHLLIWGKVQRSKDVGLLTKVDSTERPASAARYAWDQMIEHFDELLTHWPHDEEVDLADFARTVDQLGRQTLTLDNLRSDAASLCCALGNGSLGCLQQILDSGPLHGELVRQLDLLRARLDKIPPASVEQLSKRNRAAEQATLGVSSDALWLTNEACQDAMKRLAELRDAADAVCQVLGVGDAEAFQAIVTQNKWCLMPLLDRLRSAIKASVASGSSAPEDQDEQK